MNPHEAPHMPTTKAGVRKSSAHSTRGAVAGEIVVGGDPTDAGAIAQLQGGSFRIPERLKQEALPQPRKNSTFTCSGCLGVPEISPAQTSQVLWNVGERGRNRTCDPRLKRTNITSVSNNFKVAEGLP